MMAMYVSLIIITSEYSNVGNIRKCRLTFSNAHDQELFTILFEHAFMFITLQIAVLLIFAFLV